MVSGYIPGEYVATKRNEDPENDGIIGTKESKHKSINVPA